VHARVGHEVGRNLVQIHVQITGEAHRRRQVNQHARQNAIHIVEAITAPGQRKKGDSVIIFNERGAEKDSRRADEIWSMCMSVEWREDG
jgi:hypothetical protein